MLTQFIKSIPFFELLFQIAINFSAKPLIFIRKTRDKLGEDDETIYFNASIGF